MADPTPAEIMLRLDHITQQLLQVVGSVDRLTTRMEESYVRKDVYEAKHTALRADLTARDADIERDIAELKEDRKDDDKHRRQTWTAIGLTVLGVIISILVSMLEAGGLP